MNAGAAASEPSARLAAALQLSSQDDVAENLRVVARVTAEAVRRGAGLVVLPENFAFMGDEAARALHAEALGDRAAPIQAALAALAREHQVTLIAGGMPERSAEAARPYNTALAFSPSGELLA